VASTDVGDIAAMLDASNRDFVVPRDDAGALVTALATLAADPARRGAIGARNRAKVERDYSIAQMADAFEAVLREALERGKSR
jgi:glycosyltransferase involved in cell wall biosynthesis